MLYRIVPTSVTLLPYLDRSRDCMSKVGGGGGGGGLGVHEVGSLSQHTFILNTSCIVY